VPASARRRRALGLVAAAVLAPTLAACQPLAPEAEQAPEAVFTQQEVRSSRVAPPPEPVAVPPVAPPVEAPAPVVAPPVKAAPVDPAPVEAPPVAEPADAGPVGQPGTGELAGDTLYGPNDGAAQAAAQLSGSRPADAALLADMAEVPTALWLGAWVPDVTATVRQRVADAQAAGAVPVFVAYNVPGLDCGGYSASGGAGTLAGYRSWIGAVAAGIGDAEAVVVVEPDTLALLCGNPEDRFAQLRAAVAALEANPATHTYLDAGHADWIDAPTMAQRLRAAGVEDADGFALNVSNFEPTEDNVAFGSELSALLDGAHFVVDTSRNGNGPGDHWCNPAGRALGEPTTTATGNPLVDAFIWVKRVGESDGPCNGGPSAGQFWLDYALGLARG
jgi:endoglucanase